MNGWSGFLTSMTLILLTSNKQISWLIAGGLWILCAINFLDGLTIKYFRK